jgi:hypothetical protein
MPEGNGLFYFIGEKCGLVAYGERRLVRQNIFDGAQVPLIDVNGGTILDPRVSDDGRHIVFTVSRPGGGFAIRIAPVRNRPARFVGNQRRRGAYLFHSGRHGKQCLEAEAPAEIDKHLRRQPCPGTSSF